jgi:hypothetical protein
MPRFRLWLQRRFAFHLAASHFAASRFAGFVLPIAVAMIVWTALWPARASEPFPFGSELMLDAAPMPGSKRVPMIEI